jgi:hypothetical protein
MADTFSTHATGLASPADRHFAITPADEDLAFRVRALCVIADGTLVLRDEGGVDVTYNVFAGQIVPFRAVQVRAASTATVVGWY